MAVWFITGASRGIGVGMAKTVLAAGHQVVATARQANLITEALGKSDNLLAMKLDVTKQEDADAAVAETLKRFGRIDVLVNNAGYGVIGWFETVTDKQIRDQFDTNVFGTMNVTRAVLPVMRKQKAGNIFMISSGAGFISVPVSSIYASSKFALEGWTEGMAQEVEAFGIKVMLIEPGFFKSDFFTPKSLTRTDAAIPDYVEGASRIKSRFKVGMNPLGGDPAKLGKLLMDLIGKKDAPMRLAVCSDSLDAALLKLEWWKSEVEANAALSRSVDATE